MAINVNELIFEKPKSLVFTDLETSDVIARLTMLEDPSLQTTSDADEVTNAQGELIDKIYKAKKGRFESSNSLLSLDLMALQYGTEKKVASLTNKIVAPCEEIIKISDKKATLSHEPANADDLKYVHVFKDGNLGVKFEKSTTAADGKFALSGKEITFAEGVTGEVYVLYNYESESAVEVANNSENFPKTVGVTMFGIFHDKCNPNVKYLGGFVAKKGKIDPSSIEVAFNPTGKHPFAVDFVKDFCDESADLFKVFVAE